MRLPSNELPPLSGATPLASASGACQCFLDVRAATERLAAPLSAEDCGAQSMLEASPIKWHLAHTTWFFETFILERFEPQFAPFDPAFRVLFNSYYQGVGRQHPRGQRGLLTRPDLGTVQAWRANVQERMVRLLQHPASAANAELASLLELGLQHEQQHQELIVTDVKHLLWCNPTWPTYQEASAQLDEPAAAPPVLRWQRFDAGLAQIGHDGMGFAFDNELPRHQVWLDAYELATRPVTNAEYQAFIAAGGYDDPAWWLAEGWDWRSSQQITHPLYWRETAQGWCEFTLAGGRPLAPEQPVVHLSYFEADAYARWAGARLPTEAEWEAAAQGCAQDLAAGRFAASAVLHPLPAPTQHSGGCALVQMFGDVWEWTSSSYAPYPGFAPAPGAVGEYNGKFMVNQYVLRGGSCATPAGHVRASYRNFFPTTARWQFSGLRLARSVQP
ncbi:ergothioneine biosynthesis protein EgtB [Melaminivora suipulveris]|uniref:Ergothioneine biosynthesis protein EgtB n=1 Tax=Melaminivora suipulveris TaxID=2109913 RepID=A0A2R3QGJ8_9BURK|nr:ergothioneine biosynthesis protein EgtB [Melaminivora suipulveris]AVO50899.1 ergothioneine biosynthesis protein EgtB [Melaminivora suipulveris]